MGRRNTKPLEMVMDHSDKQCGNSRCGQWRRWPTGEVATNEAVGGGLLTALVANRFGNEELRLKAMADGFSRRTHGSGVYKGSVLWRTY